MPVNINITEDKYLAVITLLPGDNNKEIISFDQITQILDSSKFNYFNSTYIIEQTVNLFNKTRSKAHRIKVFDDRFQEVEQYVTLKISADAMKAMVTINIPEELLENLDDRVIRRILKNHKVAAGIQGPQIAKLLKGLRQDPRVENFLVASGSQEIISQDGSLKFHESFTRKEVVKKIIKTGENRKLIKAEARITDQEIKPGTVLLSKFLPIDGKEGTTITNKKIRSENNKHRVKDPQVVISKNITAKRFHDRIDYIANVRGIGYFFNDKIIEVEEIFDGEFKIIVGDDGMSLFLNLQAPQGGKAINIDEVKNSIEEMNIAVPVDKKLVQTSVERINRGKEEKTTRILIAAGIPPENGDNGKLRWNQNLESFYKPRVLDSGSVDYRGGQRFPFVREGKTAGIWFLSTKGKKPGKTVLGKDIAPDDGIEIHTKLGSSFDLEDSTYGDRKVKLLKARISGLLKAKKDNIFIDPVFEVKTVDYSTGNIDFDGTLVIKEAISDGFSVRCTKDIHIMGNIGACTVECEGDVVIKGGMNGGNKGLIKAGGSIYIKYVENASITAQKNIYVLNHCVLSQLIAKDEIIIGLNRAKGKIIGSQLYTWNRIETNFIGSEKSAADSQLYTGVDKELYDETEALKKRLEDLKMEISRLSQKVQKPGFTKKEKLESMQLEINEKTLELNESLEKCQEMGEKIYNEEPGEIMIKDEVFTHTNLYIGRFDKKLYANQKKIRFFLDQNRITNESLAKKR